MSAENDTVKAVMVDSKPFSDFLACLPLDFEKNIARDTTRSIGTNHHRVRLTTRYKQTGLFDKSFGLSLLPLPLTFGSFFRVIGCWVVELIVPIKLSSHDLKSDVFCLQFFHPLFELENLFDPVL